MLKLFKVELTFILPNVVGLFKGGEKKSPTNGSLQFDSRCIFLIRADIFPVAAELKVLRRALHSKWYSSCACNNYLLKSIWDIRASKNVSLTYTICSVCRVLTLKGNYVTT